MNELTKLIAEFHATLAKFEVIAARMEQREESIQVIAADPTMRDLPFPYGVIPPQLPEGKTRWVYRGDDWRVAVKADWGTRYVLFLSAGNWARTNYFSFNFHHIEAV